MGFFSTEIFIEDGYSTLAPIITVIVGVSEIMGGVIGYCLIDRYGRRALSLFGFSVMGICLAIVGVFSFLNLSFIVQAAFMIFYALIYCCSVAFIFWLYIAETLPDTGVGLASAVGWIFTILVALA